MTTQTMTIFRFGPITTSLGIHIALALILVAIRLLDAHHQPPKEIEVTFATSFSLPVQAPAQAKAMGSSQGAPVARVEKSVEQVRASRLSGLRKALSQAGTGPTSGKVLEQGNLDVSNERRSASGGLNHSVQQVRGALGNYKFSWGQFAVSGAESKGGIDLSDIDASALAGEFRRHQPEFIRCYERSLLVDSTMTGLYGLEVTRSSQGLVSGSGHLDGPGSPIAKQKLTECLSTVVRSLKIPPKLAGTTIQIALRFAR